MKLYKYSGTIEEFAVERGRISYIKLFDVTDFDKAPTRLEVFGALSEYMWHLQNQIVRRERSNALMSSALTLYSFPILIAPSFFLRIHSHTVMI